MSSSESVIIETGMMIYGSVSVTRNGAQLLLLNLGLVDPLSRFS